jgi:Conjugal transfer protein TraD
MALDRRKADTRTKIQLGGIVIKAGVGAVDAFALLGLLVEQSNRFSDQAEVQNLRRLGREFHERTTREKMQPAHDDLAV